MGRIPIIRQSKKSQLRLPLGVIKKIPTSLRKTHLDSLVEEYIKIYNIDEERSYQKASKREQAVAVRASSKSLYRSLIASLKKKIRDQADTSSSSSSSPSCFDSSSPSPEPKTEPEPESDPSKENTTSHTAQSV